MKILYNMAYFLFGTLLIGLSVAIPLVSGLFLGYSGPGFLGISFLLSLVILPVLVKPWLTNGPFQYNLQVADDIKEERSAYRYYVLGAALLVSFALLMALSFSPLGFVSPLVQLTAVLGAQAAIGIIATSASLLFLAAIPCVLTSLGVLPSFGQIAALFVRKSDQPVQASAAAQEERIASSQAGYGAPSSLRRARSPASALGASGALGAGSEIGATTAIGESALVSSHTPSAAAGDADHCPNHLTTGVSAH